MATNNDAETLSNAEKQHLLQTIETLKNLTKDYSLKYKEKEIELTNKFIQKEEEYLSKIESLKHQLTGQQSQMQVLKIDSISKSLSGAQSLIDQNKEYNQQIQSIKQKLSQQKSMNDELKQQLRDQKQINTSITKQLKDKKSEIQSLKESLKAEMNIYKPQPMSRNVSSAVEIPLAKYDTLESIEPSATIPRSTISTKPEYVSYHNTPVLVATPLPPQPIVTALHSATLVDTIFEEQEVNKYIYIYIYLCYRNVCGNLFSGHLHKLCLYIEQSGSIISR